jgi:CO dehydrogenase maturation factor
MKVIAVAGKGGTGKTTLAVMIVRWLRDKRSKSILAVDADPATNFGDMLGVKSEETIGSVREEMKARGSDLPAGMTKQRFLEYKTQTGVVETPDFDLIAMGRPEGPGCYCYANNLLRDILDTLGKNYDYVVIDNEAGMEHLSRRTTRDVDHLFMISLPTVTAIRTAGKISRVAAELAVGIKGKHLILNRMIGEPPAAVARAIEADSLQLVGSVQEDDRLLSLDMTGTPLWPGLEDSEAYGAMSALLETLVPG